MTYVYILFRYVPAEIDGCCDRPAFETVLAVYESEEEAKREQERLALEQPKYKYDPYGDDPEYLPCKYYAVAVDFIAKTKEV